MTLYSVIGYGALKPQLTLPGYTSIAEDSGRGQFFGVGTGVSCFDVPDSEVVRSIANGLPWPAVNPAKCQQYFSHLDRSKVFVSNICEGWERDAGQVEITATFLAYAKARRPAAVGHYGFPNLPRFYNSRADWRYANDAAMDAWRGSLSWLNPSMYASQHVAGLASLPHAAYIELIELLNECERLAKRGREKIVPYISHLAYDGLTETHVEQNKQRVELAKAFGVESFVLWTDKAETRLDRITMLAGAVAPDAASEQ